MRLDNQEKLRQKLIGVIGKVAPGTELREAIDRILEVRSGSIIVVGTAQELKPIISGGFRINCKFTAPRLYELAKMDGAVILSRDLKTITSANVHLVPDPRIITHEAGMRHRTAERVARQTGAFVVAISERMNTVSIYIGEDHFTLERLPLLLAKADQALQALNRYRVQLDKEYSHLNTIEIEDMVVLREVIKVIQRNEMVTRIAGEIKFLVAQLGKDGSLVSLQLGELMSGFEELRRLLIKDYMVEADSASADSVIYNLERMPGDELMDDALVSKVLGYKGTLELMNKIVRPRGYRMLSMVPRIPISVIDRLVERFDNLKNILRASPALLDEVDGVGERRAFAIKEGLDRIAESIIMESYL
ncbi:MAG: DNA integrity scanning diadenylate cyclase DisA [Actinobacteria bacterium]|nr:DNA integrity scanning diadenylate cyclase DisA [Actinomycetota bacterium]